jgi:hypothetical protein
MASARVKTAAGVKVKRCVAMALGTFQKMRRTLSTYDARL